MEFELKKKTTAETDETEDITLKFVSVKESGFSLSVKMQKRDIEEWMRLNGIEEVGERIAVSIESIGQKKLGG